jgi:hypothetical protein
MSEQESLKPIKTGESQESWAQWDPTYNKVAKEA